MGLQECEMKWEYRNVKGNENKGMCKEMGIHECERNGNTGT
jgi:hypothetical protein